MSPEAYRETELDTQKRREAPFNGPVCAAILAMGVGGCVLGALAVLTDASRTISHWLTFYVPTGALSGETSVAIFGWLATWVILGWRWRARTLNFSRISKAALFLLAISLILTFLPAVEGTIFK